MARSYGVALFAFWRKGGGKGGRAVIPEGSVFDVAVIPGIWIVRQKAFWVYFLSSRSRNLYVGVTSDLLTRVHKHKTKALGGFTARYNIDRLVYFEEHPTAEEAIGREKELKDWRRELKIKLIESDNPTWDDLSAGWYDALERDMG